MNGITNNALMMMFKVENNIPFEVKLYTFAAWKQKGYKVKKGEHAKYETELWKPCTKKIKDKNGNEKTETKLYMCKCKLFTENQVELMEAR